MRAYWTLVRRELGSQFLSWTGYVLVAAAALLLGLSFAYLAKELRSEPTDRPMTEVFYGTYFFWHILLLLTPVLTMRSFAYEKSSGTFETLMTAPVRDLQVVLAKFTGALLCYGIMWLPLLVCLWTLRRYSNGTAGLEAGPVAATYLGILLIGAMNVAMGCFASAITRSQVIAAILSFVGGFALFSVSYLAMTFSAKTGWEAQLFNHVSLIEQMQDFAGGVVDTRPLVLCLSCTVFFLFLTYKAVESRRWK